MRAIEALRKIGEFEFVQESLENTPEIEKLFKREKFDAIIHFAAFIEVFESTQNPLKYYLNNTANAMNLIALANKYGVKDFIFTYPEDSYTYQVSLLSAGFESLTFYHFSIKEIRSV